MVDANAQQSKTDEDKHARPIRLLLRFVVGTWWQVLGIFVPPPFNRSAPYKAAVAWLKVFEPTKDRLSAIRCSDSALHPAGSPGHTGLDALSRGLC